MKQILMTVLATVAGIAVAALGLGAMGVVDLSKLQEALTSSSSAPVAQPSTTTGTGEAIKVGNVDTILCEGTLNPEKQADGSFKCVPSVNLTTECMGPDGEAYKKDDKKTFYKTAEKTEENKNQKITCESVEKVCVNGNFAPVGSTDDSAKAEFAHFDCKVIDRTKTDEIPCKTDAGLEVPPGSTQVRFLKNEVAADEDCIHIEEYCGADGAWKTKFPTHNMLKCDFKGSYTPEYMKENPEEVFDTNGELNEVAKGEIKIDPTKKKCTTPWGETIKHGEKVISFRDKVVRFDKECHSRTHTCVDGALEFVDAYNYPTCTIEGPDACIIEATNVSIFHDSEKKLYAKGRMVNGKRECPEQIRHCYDMKLDGSDEYIYPTCGPAPKTAVPAKPNPNRCPSPFVGESEIYDHGREGVGYFKNSVGRLESCDGEVNGKINKVAVSCQYGTIQPIGNVTKIWRSCTKGTPKDCTAPWGAVVKHGTSVQAYNVAGVAFGGSCEAQTRVCNDGVLDGSNQFQSCTVAKAAGCSNACGNVEHGGKITSYVNSSVARGNGETCTSSQIVSTCSNGKFSPAPADFCSCKVDQPLNCVGPNGENVSHLGYLTLYKFASVPGRAEDGVDECPREVRQCVNGVLRKSDGTPSPFTYSFKKCDVIPPTGGAAGTQ